VVVAPVWSNPGGRFAFLATGQNLFNATREIKTAELETPHRYPHGQALQGHRKPRRHRKAGMPEMPDSRFLEATFGQWLLFLLEFFLLENRLQRL
jgi:hypothetical protein